MEVREDRIKGLRKGLISQPNTPIEDLWHRKAAELDRLSRAVGHFLIVKCNFLHAFLSVEKKFSF